MSGPAVVIGYIILIPSILGILFSCMMVFLSFQGTSSSMGTTSTEARRTLATAGIPPSVVDKAVNSQTISEQERSLLSQEQRTTLKSVEAQLAYGTVGAGAAGTAIGGIFLCLGVGAFVGGLIGWLLVMKKRVLQCDMCGATVSAS
ncbi:MAG: hypothetical protein KIS91_11725 [Anaerolineae bacterium]|nr:hypothetical protein [Anaerolineae bacterium]